MEIRIAKEDDIPEISQLLVRNFDEIMPKYHSKEVLEKYKAHNSIESLYNQLKWKDIFVAVTQNKIVGTCAHANFGTVGNPKYSISNFYVLPELHSNGIGRLLFNAIYEESKKNNVEYLHVPSSLNAIGFYEKMGFVIENDQPDSKDEITWMIMKI